MERSKSVPTDLRRNNEESTPCPGPRFITSDYSIEFYKDPYGFFTSKSQKFNSDVFYGRFLLKTTTFVGSHAAVAELLKDEYTDFDMGYKEYLSAIYGDIVLFSEANDVESCRKCIQDILYDVDRVKPIKDRVNEIITTSFDAVDLTHDISLYDLFKQLATETMISLFLGVNSEQEKDLSKTIAELSVTHWHGIISVPVNLKLPVFSSAYNKAIEARATLVNIAKERLSHQRETIENNQQTSNNESNSKCPFRNGFLGGFNETEGFKNEDSRLDNLLLFVTALGPKAIASILTSVVIQCQNFPPDKIYATDGTPDQKFLTQILLEVMRLWPPFIGGRRVAVRDSTIAGYYIPAGRPVVFHTLAAHRDPLVFPDPETFDPTRWDEHVTLNPDEPAVDPFSVLFTFGAGNRSCIGQNLMLQLIKDILLCFFSRWDCTISNVSSCTDYKWLPVSRPKTKPLARLELR